MQMNVVTVAQTLVLVKLSKGGAQSGRSSGGTLEKSYGQQCFDLSSLTCVQLLNVHGGARPRG